MQLEKTLYFILGIDFTITLLQGIFQVTLRYFEWIKQYGGPVIVWSSLYFTNISRQIGKLSIGQIFKSPYQ